MTKLNVVPARRFRVLAQTALIRSYKVIGLIALTGILLGLISFFTVNLFYLVNRSWVRPLVLSPTHSSVLDSMTTLSAESARRDELVSERDLLKAELAGIDRILELNRDFQKQFEGAMSDKAVSRLRGAQAYEAMVARRAYAESIIERERNAARKQAIERKIASLDAAIARYDKVIEQIRSSAYIVALERKVTVAFVPYENLDEVEEGDPIYACRWGLVWCREVGRVGAHLQGEVTDTHPNSGKPLRGLMVEIRLDDTGAAKERTLFAGKRPFWIL
ncbi:MAG TPA: hypothetical protein VKZ63_04925 [Kofleriaceae bacterium]|nr:hypothetical protein [Kofleriaceae bacterium]